MELTDNEILLIEIIRHFDFLRRYGYSISELSLYGKAGRPAYIIYDAYRNRLRIEFSMGHLKVEVLHCVFFLRTKKINVSDVAKQHGLWFDSVCSVFEKIESYSAFIKKYSEEILGRKMLQNAASILDLTGNKKDTNDSC